jgi:chromosome segregation ATPase
MLFRRVVGLLALAFGLVGVAACGAGAYGVWRVQSRLNRANDKVFDAVDRGLAAVQDRIPVAQERVRQSKITADEVGEALRGWATKKAQDRAVAKLEIDNRAEKLAGQLQAVDLRLDASTMAVRDVRQLLELGQGLGADVDPTSTDEVLALLASLQAPLHEAEQTVAEVRRFTDPDRESPEERLIRVAKLLVRLLATFGEVESRLDKCMARLSELRAEARQLKERTSNRILVGAVACYALLAWGAAGQAALCRWGWSCCRRRHSPTAPAG